MLAAIKKELTPAEGAEPGAKKPAAGSADPAAAKAAATAKAAEDTKKKQEADTAAKAKQEADAKALKGKTSKDFVLTPEEKKILGPKAQQRFQQLHAYAKDKESALANLQVQYAQMHEARDGMMEAFQEYKVTPGDMRQLFTYNKAVKEGRLDEALQIVEGTRTALLKALGREAPGVDLLKDYPDLSKQVEEQEITRAAALEVAQARRAKANAEHQGHVRQQQTQGAQQIARARQQGEADIATWATKMAKEDIDYAAKEEKVLARVPSVVRRYPPHLWLPTLQEIYDSIELVKQPGAEALNGGHQPLRPSGARPGAKQATDMKDAIAQGLGYPAAG